MRTLSKKPVILCVLDGWGWREDPQNNGILQARTPTFGRFLNTYPFTTLIASGEEVGLPKGQMGNSEVGHLHLGMGRLVKQDLCRVDDAIAEKTLQESQVLRSFISVLKKNGGAAHILGLLSPGGVHSHQKHIQELVSLLAEEKIPVYMHVLLDGRDTPPKSGLSYLQEFISKCGKDMTIQTIAGRYYTMDRDKRWDRIQKGYNSLMEAKGEVFEDPIEWVKSNYQQGNTDEFITPAHFQGYDGVKKGDGLLFANFRSDRMLQIASSLTEEDFPYFERGIINPFSKVIGLVSYYSELDKKIEPVFPPFYPKGGLGEIISKAGFKQLRIAETEKYAHVTFFFDGGRDEIFENEDRILIPSPKVATYDLTPMMSAYEITDALILKIRENTYDFIVVNYANSDMVGHTGKKEAIIKAIETVDECLGKLEKAVLEANGVLIVTADHGNAECMVDPVTQEPHTAHTSNPVPFFIINGPKDIKKLKSGRSLKDVAPTICEIMGIPVPKQMTGHSILDNGY